MKKNIVILGATGTVGSKIAQVLINQGYHVTLAGRHTEKLETYREQGAESATTRYLPEKSWKKALPSLFLLEHYSWPIPTFLRDLSNMHG